jgi:hypothetical protein
MDGPGQMYPAKKGEIKWNPINMQIQYWKIKSIT